MKNIGSIRLVAWLIGAMIVSSSAELTRVTENSRCLTYESSKVGARYVKHLQHHFERILKRINFATPDGKEWFVKLITSRETFKRDLLVWGFSKMDKNNNSFIDPSEAVNGRWSLGRGSRACNLAFFQKCDEDRSNGVSRKEWLNCFNILECDKICSHGQRLDTSLCQCSCEFRVVQGRVLSSSGAPLHDTRISLGSSPYTELTKTNKSGHFTVEGGCERLSYMVTRTGYIPQRFESGTQPDDRPVLIFLDDADPPSISVQPKSKMLFSGQSVNLTCEAEGPPPIKLTWYHNGTLLQQVTFGTKTHLFIANVTGAQGVYNCKATNDYGSEISIPAELKVKKAEDALDTCNPIPRSHIIQLPKECTVQSTGENVLDIGKCSDGPCLGSSSFNQSCPGNKEDCCCGPKGDEYQERVVISCRYHSDTMELSRVTECGCSSCSKQKTFMKGQVVGGPSQEPVKNVKVIFKKNLADITKEDGKFSFPIPEDVDRATVTFQDPEDRFFDTTQVLPFQRGRSVFHKIVLQEEDPPVTFDSSEDVRVPLGHTGDNMAELEIPADNLLKKDGTPFKGKAKLRVSLTDPRNASDLLSAPGDFSTVDQSGSVQPLKTYGILRIKIQDQNNERLDLAGNGRLRLDARKIKLPRNSTAEMAPLLWWLDEKTGRWRQMGDMRPVNNSRSKRSLFGTRFYIGDIQTDKISVINIDIPWKRCYVRVQAFAKVGKEMKPVREATMTLIGKERAEQEQYYGYTRETTNKDGVACIPAWCDSDVVLQSSLEQLYPAIHLEPDNSTLETLPSEIGASIHRVGEDGSSSFTFTTKVSSQSGPIFANDEMNKCLDPDDNLRAFKFYTEKIQRQQCFIRAQTFTVNGNEIESDPWIKVVVFDKAVNSEPLSNYGWPFWRLTDDYGVACIPVRCGFEVTLQAAKDAVQLIPDHTILSKLAPELDASIALSVFSFTTKVTSQLGPIFSEPEMCSSADDNLIAFKFYYRVNRTKPSEIDDFGSRPPGHPLSWYKSDAAISDKEVTKCFVKVNIEFYPRIPLPMVSVESFTPDRKTMYGLSTKRPTLNNKFIIRNITEELGVSVKNFSSSSACVEYRCSEKDRQTFILVKLLTHRCFYEWQKESFWWDVYETWNYEYDYPRNTPAFAPFDISDSTVGFYSGPGKVAKERCQAGRMGDIGTDDISKPISDKNPLFTVQGCAGY